MDRKLTREALRLLERHEPFVRATVVKTVGSVPGKLGASMLLRRDGTTLGTVGGASLEEKVKEHAQAAFLRRAGDLHHFDLRAWSPGGLPSLCGGSVDVAIEYVAARPNLLLWGGGHVSRAIAEILPTLEYDYTVADDRPDWASAERFPTAARTIVTEPERLFDEVEPEVYTHLFLLGYDALKDLEVLHQALSRFPNFIGLIASASKRGHMFQELRRRGVPEKALERIRSPIGLPIGAESPGEIAVAVVAELIADQHPSTERMRTSRRARIPEPEDRAAR